MKVLFITNIPSPNRVAFFNEMGKLCKLIVCYERHSASDRDVNWVGGSAEFFSEIYVKGHPLSTDRSFGLGVLRAIKSTPFDKLIIAGYASPSVMLAIAYCRLHKIKYYIESDGGFNKEDRFPKILLKKFLLRGAMGHFTTCEEHVAYLQSIGIKQANIVKYPFTSLNKSNILSSPPSPETKKSLRNELGITEKKIVLSVGQFIFRKGFDILIEATNLIDNSVGVYIIGGTPTQEYIDLKERYKLHNIHFIEFLPKVQLKKWYCAADLFVLPTREDIWGLVINEAMACGLPVITTTKCVAGLELVENGQNGYIVPTNNKEFLFEKMNVVLNEGRLQKSMAHKSLEIIRDYTIENMVNTHLENLRS